MQFSHRLTVSLLLVIVVFFYACTSEKENTGSSSQTELPKNIVEVRDAWARPAKQGMTGGAYLTIANGTNQADTLIRVSSDAAVTTEVHESYQQEDGLSGMRPAGNLPIEAGSTLELKPGGYHLMLMQLNRELAVGDSISAILYFSSSDSLAVQIPIRNS